MTQTETTPFTVVRKTYAHPVEDVFDAWLDPEALRRFMCPSPGQVSHASCDPRVGGAFRIDMTLGDDTHEHWGEYVEISRPNRLVFTWTSPAVPSSEVTLEFVDRGSSTELTLTHRGFDSQEMADKHNQGWTSIMERLDGDALAS